MKCFYCREVIKWEWLKTVLCIDTTSHRKCLKYYIKTGSLPQSTLDSKEVMDAQRAIRNSAAQAQMHPIAQKSAVPTVSHPPKKKKRKKKKLKKSDV